MSVDRLSFGELRSLYGFDFSRKTFMRHIYPRLPESRFAVSNEIKNRVLRIKSSTRVSPYSLLREMYPQHYSAYLHMFEHARAASLEVDPDFCPIGVLGFSRFVDYMGDVPEYMDNPQRGRIDHTKGYVKGNFHWQDRADNLAELRSRMDYTYLWESQRRAVKNRKLLSVLEENTGGCILLSYLRPIVSYSTDKRLIRTLREYGCTCTRLGAGEYIITIPSDFT